MPRLFAVEELPAEQTAPEPLIPLACWLFLGWPGCRPALPLRKQAFLIYLLTFTLQTFAERGLRGLREFQTIPQFSDPGCSRGELLVKLPNGFVGSRIQSRRLPVAVAWQYFGDFRVEACFTVIGRRTAANRYPIRLLGGLFATSQDRARRRL